MNGPCPKCGALNSGAACTKCGNDQNLGRRVGERFVVDEPLGSGGMGSIYRGHDERLGEIVAIKFLKRTFSSDFIFRERFRREALSLAKLRHPGIVTVLDFGDVDEDLYMVLELVHGTTLEEILESEGALTPLRAGGLFDQVLASLEICHEHDLVHRDIKPSNVMVTKIGGVEHVKIIDFGLARMGRGMADKLTETGAVHGTPHYMSPEQCRGEEVGPEADVYSTALMFYELLTGALPFHGDNAAAFMAQHLFVEPVSLHEVAPHISAGVSAVIHDALAKEPAERPTAREMRHALASAFKGTDPRTLADTAAAERSRVSGLKRSDRALTGRPHAEATTAPVIGSIIVWMPKDDRSAGLRGSLGASGLSCSLWTREEPPDMQGDNIAVVLSARASGLTRVAQIRKTDPKVPVIVVDVQGPEETTAAIRAGASDMLLLAAPDADLASKVKRLLKRRTKR